MSWEEYRKQAKMSEEKFAKNLINPIWANDYENMKEHWDVKGVFKNKTYRFDVKGMKKKNRWDNNFQDDYIVFERNKYWLIVDRQELLNHVVNRLKEKGYEKGKGIYQVYQRDGRQDKITMVPYEDIEKLTNIEKVDKDDTKTNI
jgi:hypothetical protein